MTTQTNLTRQQAYEACVKAWAIIISLLLLSLVSLSMSCSQEFQQAFADYHNTLTPPSSLVYPYKIYDGTNTFLVKTYEINDCRNISFTNYYMVTLIWNPRMIDYENHYYPYNGLVEISAGKWTLIQR